MEMLNWVVPWKSWKRSSSSSSSPHVSVAVAVFFCALLSLLLSCTIISLSGSALVYFTSDTTAFFVSNNPTTTTTTTAANAAGDIAATVGIIHQGNNSSATKFLSYSNSTTTNNPSNYSVVTDLPAPAEIWQQEVVYSRRESENLDSNTSTTTTTTEVTALTTPADQPQGSREESEVEYGDEDPNRSWSPVASPSLADETRKPDMSNHTEEEEEEEEASLTTTTTGPSLASPAILQLPNPEREVEKFLMPILSYQVGAGNQLMEYMSAAIIARALNRTLCLAEFFAGPHRHKGISVKGEYGWLAMENRYDKATLSRFVRVTSKNNCLKQCHSKLDARWLLKSMREPILTGWKSVPTTKEAVQYKDWAKWQATDDIAESLGSSNERCVGVGGLYPGPRWRGAFLAVSAFLQPSQSVATLADKLQELAIGSNVPYLAVHWRFEESECGPHKLGLCFVRCSDGAVIDSGLHPNAKEWIGLSIDQCKGNGHSLGHFRGVGLDKFDVFDAIFDHAQKNNVKTVYLATDGWIRGERGVALVKEAVEELRNRGLAVVGLWKIQNLPNFSNGSTFDPMSTLGKGPASSHQIALIEQEICTRSTVFLGSGQSTWSLAIFRLRLARRHAKQILESQLGSSATGGAEKKQLQEVLIKQVEEDETVIKELMEDKHAAGLACRFTRYFNRIRVNATLETYADEAPDGWLDLEACEGRIGQGGKCEVAKCF